MKNFEDQKKTELVNKGIEEEDEFKDKGNKLEKKIGDYINGLNIAITELDKINQK